MKICADKKIIRFRKIIGTKYLKEDMKHFILIFSLINIKKAEHECLRPQSQVKICIENR